MAFVACKLGLLAKRLINLLLVIFLLYWVSSFLYWFCVLRVLKPSPYLMIQDECIFLYGTDGFVDDNRTCMQKIIRNSVTHT